MDRKVRIRVDLDFVDKEWCDIPFVFPILNINEMKLSYYHKKQVEGRCNTWNKIIERVEMSIDADFIVFPKNYKLWYQKKIKKLCKIAKKNNKKVIVFYMSDVENRLPYIDNLILFRSSLNSKNPNNEYPMPWFPEDLGEYNKNLVDKINFKKPSIWYVWYYWYYNLKTKIKYYFYRIYKVILQIKPVWYAIYLFFNYIYTDENLYSAVNIMWIWWIYRKKTIDVIKREKRVKFNFIKREKWLWIYEKDVLRTEYIDNLINSDFPLVIRWFWNFSFRLSEVMSLWKIPLFIDTDCKLPFENEINYKDLFIWVPYKDVENFYDYINKYLNKNKNKLEQNWKQIRKIYEDYYTLTGYYTKIISILVS